MSTYSRNNPDELPLYDAFAGQRRAPLIPRGKPVATVTKEDGMYSVRVGAVLGYWPMNERRFETSDDAHQWCRLYMPEGAAVQWEVRP